MAKILIVDDEEHMRLVLREALERDNNEIIEAKDGMEASSLYQDVDLIITDLVMPEKNGLDLIMEIKEKRPDLPIMAISGGGGITGRFDYLPISKIVGAKAIYNKPFSLRELRDQVAVLLNLKGPTEAISSAQVR